MSALTPPVRKPSSTNFLTKHMPSFSSCSKKTIVTPVEEESLAGTAGSSAASSCSDLNVLVMHTPLRAPLPARQQVSKPLPPVKSESNPILFRGKRLALRSWTANIKEAFQATKARLEEIREDPEYELGLIALAELCIPLTIIHQPGEQPPPEHASVPPTPVVAEPTVKLTAEPAGQLSNSQSTDRFVTGEAMIPLPKDSRATSLWKAAKSVVLKSRKTSTESQPSSGMDLAETKSVLETALEEEHVARQNVLCTSAMLKLEMDNLVIVLLLWLSLTFLGWVSRWVLLPHFWILAYALAICWSQIQALYLEPMKFAHGPFDNRLSSIEQLSDKPQAVLTFSYWVCRLTIDPQALLGMWPGTKDNALLYYYSKHQHRRLRSKVGWYRAMSLTCWILRIFAFSAVHYLLSVICMGWTAGNASFTHWQYIILTGAVACKVCKWTMRLMQRQEDLIYWQTAGLKREHARKLRRLQKQLSAGNLTEEQLSMVRDSEPEPEGYSCVYEEPKQL